MRWNLRMTKSVWIGIACFCVALCGGAIRAGAQSATHGAIGGTIYDQHGAVIAGAVVTATNPATGTVRSETTNKEGFYRITSLEPGTYSVTVVSDTTGNATLGSYAYLPYGDSDPPHIAACLGAGTAASTCGTPAGTEFGYAGYRYDPETGLYHTGARYYDPRLGRFLQTDPAGHAAGPNLYAYVGNDPLNATDPSGLFTLQIGVAGGGTILGFVVPQGGFGIVLDTHGNVGTYSYTGIGAGIGVEAGVGGSVQFSNAKTIYDLSDSFSNSSVHGGAGVGGSVDYFTGNSANGPVTGGGISFGASSGASASLTQTTTQICGSSGCAGSALPPVLSGAATLIAPGTAAASPTRSPSLK